MTRGRQASLFPEETFIKEPNLKQETTLLCDIDSCNEDIDLTLDDKGTLAHRANDLLNAKFELMPTLFDPIIPMGEMIAIIGASETGKSSLARQLALNVVTGTDFLGFKNNAKLKSALVVSTEDSINAISTLLIKNVQSLNYKGQDIKKLKYLFYSENIIDNIKATISIEPVDAIIIDSPTDIFDGKDFNDAIQVRHFLNKFKLITQEHECTVIFIHHTGKRAEYSSPSKNNTVGSQAFEAAMRLVFELRSDPTDSDLRYLCIVKSNYLPANAKKEALILRFDENLTFHDTDKTIAISDIVLPRHGNNKKLPTNYTDEYHTKFLLEIYTKEGKAFYTQTELKQAVQKYYNCSEKPARGFVEFYRNKEWIINTSEKSNKNTYKLSSNISN